MNYIFLEDICSIEKIKSWTSEHIEAHNPNSAGDEYKHEGDMHRFSDGEGFDVSPTVEGFGVGVEIWFGHCYDVIQYVYYY